MAKGKIMKTTVDALEPKRRADGSLTDNFLWDTELKGFACKATAGGKKVFILQYCIGGRAGKDQRLTLGVHGSITADQARKMAFAERGKIAAGQDPAAARRENKHKLAGATFEGAVAHFFAIHAKETRYWREKRRVLCPVSCTGLRPFKIGPHRMFRQPGKQRAVGIGDDFLNQCGYAVTMMPG